MLELQYLLTGDEEYSRLAEEQLKREMRMEYYEASNMAGVVDSVLASIGKTVASAYNASFGRFTRKLKYDSLSKIAVEEVDSYLERWASKVWDMDCYYIGRCEGDVMLTVAEYRLDNTIKNYLTEKDFSGALRDFREVLFLILKEATMTIWTK